MYPATMCFMVERTMRARIGLRRLRLGEPSCPAQADGSGYHRATADLGEADLVLGEGGLIGSLTRADMDWVIEDRWPTTCACGEPFTESDYWLVDQDELWKRTDGLPGRWTTRDLPPGAMLDTWWLKGEHAHGLTQPGDDGLVLSAVCPNGALWTIDHQARNCDRPGEDHHCWVRHGTPPLITVDKAGDTCAAGAGSIQADDYHGFLVAGRFTAG